LSGHIRTDELARFRAGAVRAGRAARIAAHLAGCSRCAGVESQLAGVTAMLATVSMPPMPDSLTQRLRMTLSEEASRRAATPDAPAARSGARRSWRPRVPNWSSPLVLRSLAATGVLALIAGGGLVLANLGNSGSTAVSARQAEPASGPAPRPQNTDALPSGGSVATAGTLPVKYSFQGRHIITNVVVSNFNYTKSDLVTGVRARIDNPLVVPGSTVSRPGTSAHGTSGVSVKQLSGCLSRVASGHQILEAEVARYLALPATIIVLKPIGHIVDVIVVGSACSATRSDVLSRLSLTGG
jgi:hypothetical protein